MHEDDKIARRLARRQAANRRHRLESLTLAELLDQAEAVETYAYGATRRRS